MKTLLPVLLFLFIVSGVFGQGDLQSQSFLDNKITLQVPPGLHKMTDEQFKLKYPNPNNKPSLVLTDDNVEVNLVINHMKQYDLNDEQLEWFKNGQVDAMKKKYPDMKILGDGVTTANGKKVAFIKAMTPARDMQIYNYFLFTHLEGKLLLLSFNCGEKLKKDWEKTADNIMGSLKVSE